ncbi:hypothetical protein BC833DRAFT_605042 [Globomyces pollinis-pini]|nr:hypothetical protein BC833DRAFT_605042 [Globomyces pollinis-pini]
MSNENIHSPKPKKKWIFSRPTSPKPDHRSSSPNLNSPQDSPQRAPSPLFALFGRTTSNDGLANEQKDSKGSFSFLSSKKKPPTPNGSQEGLTPSSAISNDNHMNSSTKTSPLTTFPTEDSTKKKQSTLKRVISSTVPFLSWFKSNQPQETDMVNPMLHLASLSLNMSETAEDGTEHQSTIHRVIKDENRLAPGFWGDADDDVSSVESFDSHIERSLTIDSNDSVGRLDRMESTVELREQQIMSSKSQSPELSIEEKLQIVFELPTIEKYENEFACWFVRSVLLKGYMYITENHVCFYSSLPTIPGAAIKSGFLQKRSRLGPKKRFTPYWFVLKSDALYIYADSSKLYHPRSVIQFKNIIDVRPSTSIIGFHIITHTKDYTFKADSDLLTKEWVDSINSAITTAKNIGNDVRLVLPFACITEINLVKTTFNSESLRIEVTSDERSFLKEEYIFTYFTNALAARDLLLDLLTKTRKMISESPRSSTSSNRSNRSSQSGRLLHGPNSRKSLDKMAPKKVEGDEGLPPRVMSIQRLSDGHRKSNSFAAPASAPTALSVPDIRVEDEGKRLSMEEPRQSVEKRRSWWYHRKTSSDCGDMSAAVAATEETTKTANFRKYFGVPDGEILVQSFTAYLIRMLPLMGKVYISTNYICFKSRLVGMREKVVIPLIDILRIEKGKGYSPFYYAVVITITSRDEIIFDFPSVDAQQRCITLLHDRIAEINNSKNLLIADPKSSKRISILAEMKHKEHHLKDTFSQDELENITPLVTKISKPSPMHITCLTIGTRGDVQPYIALCKGLMADGHTCRIATHAEYQSWIESFGIEFREVKGNPAELMQLCVENGMFTVSFMREALGKFSGWFDELLISCHQSCQGTDLIIESPSAFGGVHVAEKLNIPFFSSMPMLWTRTKMYPHPMGMAEKNMGGTFNYMSHVLFEQVLWKATLPHINKWRAESLDLPPVSYALEQKTTPYIYSFSPTIVPPPNDWSDWVHVCGYWFLDNPDGDKWQPPESLSKFLKDGPPPVYIGFGSIIVPDPDEMTRIIIEAVVKSGVRVILAKGWSGRSQTEPATVFTYPPCIYPLSSVPHDWLFPQLAGVVHHGGAGSSAAGFRAGVPTIIRPFFGDQFFWGERVIDLGIGLVLRKLTVEGLSNALISITTDTKMKEQARKVGMAIRNENGVEKAIEYIYRDLEFSKERIQEIRKIHGRRKS